MTEESQRLEEGTVQVPKNTGIPGFLHTIQEILKLPRVQSITIDAKGRVVYRRYVVNGERGQIEVGFEKVEPYALIRNGPLEEVTSSAVNAAVILASMLDAASNEGLHPVAFVAGANTVLWDWYVKSTGFEVYSREFLCGLPLLQDRHVPDTAIILCAAGNKNAGLVDAQKSYKLEMEIADMSTDVEVI